MSLRLQTVELAHLQSFLTVCRLGTLGKAAKHLRISQPAISAHLKSLEKGMGRKLLVRSPRGVKPTPAGETLRWQIEIHLDKLVALALPNLELKGLAVVGGPADLLSMRVLPALKPLYTSGIQIKVKTGNAENLLDRLAADELDLVIATRWPSARMDLKFRPLYDEEYVLVGDEYWYKRFAGRSAEKVLKGLSAASFVAFDEQLPLIRDYPLMRQEFRRIFGHRTGDHVALYIADLRALRDAAIAGIGVTVLPRYLVADALMNKRLYELFTPSQPRFNTIYIATQRGPLHPRLQQIVNTLKAAAPSWE